MMLANRQGWPAKKHCPSLVRPYYDERSELIESDGWVCRGEQLEVPRLLRRDMLNQIHSSHIDIGGCVQRVREILYWLGMSAEMRDFVSRPTDQHRPAKS